MTKIDRNLKVLMKRKNVTQSKVSKTIGMNKTTLFNYCNGVIPRNVLTLKKLADYFGVTIDDLLFKEIK